MQSANRLLGAHRSATRAAQRAVDLSNALADPDAAAVTIKTILRRYGEPDPIDLTDEDTGALRDAADRLRTVLVADSTREAVDALNGMLAAPTGGLRLTDHSGTTTWHPHLDRDDDAPWAEWFTSSSAFALSLLIWEYQRPPCRACASESCSNVLLSVGNGPERRFCSRRCATRDRVNAHRARTAALRQR